jgi:MFS family permease
MSSTKNSIIHDPFAALRYKEFKFFLYARFFLTVAIQMQSVIVGWQVYTHTKDVLDLGLIGLAEALPFIAVSLFAGHVADTFNRKIIILIGILFMLISSIGFLYLSRHDELINQWGVLPFFYITSFIGITRGFLAAAFPSFMSQLLPRTMYANAATWNSTVWHIASILGPTLAGFICAISFTTAYQINIILIAIAIISFLFIASKPLQKPEIKEGLLKSLSVGIKFVFSNQLILGALSLDLFAVLFGGAVAILPAFANEVLRVTSVELGFLRAAPAAGAVIMALIIAYFPPQKNAGRNLFLSIIGFGIATIFFAFSSNYYWSLFFLFLTGAFDNVSVVVRHTILQLSTPDQMRGRVSAVNSIFIGSSNEIGGFESGLAAKFMGLVPSVAFGGIMTVIIVLITAKLTPKLRKLNLNTIE